ncbi:unnamed protein product [Ectocarpus sp. 6 AP-2014]
MSKERASSNLATSLASASASLNEVNSSTSVRSTKRRKRGDVSAAKARVESGTLLERSDIDNITDVLANEYLKSMGLPTSGKVVDKRERLLQVFAKNKWMVYTPDAVDGGAGATRAAAAAPTPELPRAGQGRGSRAGLLGEHCSLRVENRERRPGRISKGCPLPGNRAELLRR